MDRTKFLMKHFGLTKRPSPTYKQYFTFGELQKLLIDYEKAINYTRCSTQLPNVYEGTLNNDRIKIIRTLADNYNVNIDTIRSLFNDGADFYKQTLTK